MNRTHASICGIGICPWLIASTSFAQNLPRELNDQIRAASGVDVNALLNPSELDGQPRISGGGWYDHVTIPPVTGEVVGALFDVATITPVDQIVHGGASREMRVVINWDALERLDPQVKDNRMAIPVFDGGALEIEFFAKEARADDQYTWFGKIAGIAVSDVILVRHQDYVVMLMRDYATPRTWQLEWTAPAGYVLEELSMEERSGDWCATGRAPDAVPQDDGPGSVSAGAAVDSFDEVDVMFLTTNQAAGEYGSLPNFQANVQLFINDFNMRAANSSSTVRLRISNVYWGNFYSENSDGGVDLDLLLANNDGVLDWVHAERDLIRADLVALIRKEAWDGNCTFGGCSVGIAKRPPTLGSMATLGFSVTSLQFNEFETFSHEIGHNFGACHNAGAGGCSSGSSITSAPNGIVQPGNCTSCPGFSRRTTMSYSPSCAFSNAVIPYFSRLNLTLGTSCGTYQMWDGVSQVQGLIAFVQPTISQNRIASSQMWCYPYGCPSNACSWGNGTIYFPWARIYEGVAAVHGGADEGVVRPQPGVYEETLNHGGPVNYGTPCKIIPDGPVVLR